MFVVIHIVLFVLFIVHVCFFSFLFMFVCFLFTSKIERVVIPENSGITRNFNARSKNKKIDTAHKSNRRKNHKQNK